MKKHGETKSRNACPPPEKQGHNQEIQEKRGIARAVDHPFFAEETPDDGKLGSLAEVIAHWLSLKPVRRKLGHAPTKVDDPNLQSQQPETPGGHGLRPQARP